jgi:hypothetical protein
MLRAFLTFSAVFLGLNAAPCIAATFRLQSSIADTGPTYNYGSASFVLTSGSAKNFTASGQFSYLTSYRDSSGNVVNPSTPSALQDWNITVTNTTDSISYVYTPATSTSATVGNDTIQVTCSSVSNCASNTLFSFQFGQSINSAIGNSVGGSDNTMALSSVASNLTGSVSALSGQADFVPFSPSLLSFAPVALFFARFKKSIFSR